MSIFKWVDEFSVCIKEFDDQHKKAIDLFNKVLRSKDNEQKQEFIESVNELTTFWEAHFKYEEELMKEYEYADFDSHRSEHEEVLKNMENLHKMYSKGFDDVFSCLRLLLNQWVEVHIADEDKKLGVFLHARGIT